MGLRLRGYVLLVFLRAIFREVRSWTSPAVGLVKDFISFKGPFLAAAIAFYAFLSLFPLTIALITLLHLTLGERGFDEVLHDAILRQIPVLNETETGPSFVEDFISHATSNSGVTTSISGLVLFIATLGVFSAIRESINVMWGLERRRGFLNQRVVEAALMIIASLLLLTSIVVSGVFSFLEEIGHVIALDTEGIRHSLINFMGVTLPWVITYVVLTVIYWWLPNTKTSIKEIAPVSLIATIAFELAKFVFVVYLHHGSERILSIYGSLAVVMMFFVFIYVEAVIMLAGAMICAKWTKYLRSSNQKLLIANPTSRFDRLGNRIRTWFAVQE